MCVWFALRWHNVHAKSYLNSSSDSPGETCRRSEIMRSFSSQIPILRKEPCACRSGASLIKM